MAPPMVGETKEIFDRLTEDAMKLLDNGDYSKILRSQLHQVLEYNVNRLTNTGLYISMS